MRDTEMFLERALIEDGLLDHEAIAEARQYGLKHDLDLVDALVRSGVLQPRELAMTRAALCEVPYVSLADYHACHSNTKLIPQAVAQRHCVFPLFIIDNVLTLAMEDPLNLEATDQVRQITKCEVDPVLCDRDELRSVIARAYSLSTSVAAGPTIGPEDVAEDAEATSPIVAAVNQLLSDAISERASDVHLNPDEDRVHLRYRIDGVLHLRQGPPLTMHSGIVQRLKVMAHLDLTQTRRPQDGRFRFVAHSASGAAAGAREQAVDVRISTMPTVSGENVVMRLLTRSAKVPDLRDLGMSGPIFGEVEKLLAQPHGMLLVSGPTGSGKTTTLYAALSRLNTPSRNLMTIEDPVEIRLPYVRQIQTHSEIGLTFASALRSILRQDPDVVLVGEIRDGETATIALQAALTGHIVLSTVHTNDAAGVVARLRDFGLPPFVINSAVLGALAQRLLRKVCDECAAPAPLQSIDPLLRRRFGLVDGSAECGGLRRGKGCRRCSQTGYRGRLGVFELFTFTPAVRNLIENGSSTERIRELAVRSGMKPLWRDALEKAQIGLTTVEEVGSIAAMCLFEVPETEHVRQAA